MTEIKRCERLVVMKGYRMKASKKLTLDQAAERMADLCLERLAALPPAQRLKMLKAFQAVVNACK